MPSHNPQYHQLLLIACEKGDVSEVKRLTALTDGAYHANEALCLAARKGHHECVKILVPIDDHQEECNEALRYASANGHIKCVKMLLPGSNPKSKASRALQYAVEFGHIEIAELLYPLSKPHAALCDLKYNFPNEYKTWGWLEEKIKNECLFKRLSQTLSAKGMDAPSLKM